mmetsp:Transcript_99871/g.277943  ORF Transcript_99871/g.277943 Transcript_99871/m.277943 type:complete len:201 (-) Transcript_99871:312-914(-)
MSKVKALVTRLLAYKGKPNGTASMDTVLFKAGGALNDGTETDARAPYRYPAPGSQPQARIPQGPEARVYDIKYYPRDTRRDSSWRPVEAIEEAFHPSTRNLLAPDGLVEDAAEKPGSAGNRNPDVIDKYDRTGLRTAMTTSVAATVASLQSFAPTQLVRCEWEDEAEAIVAEYTAKGLPPCAGRRQSTEGQTALRYRARW